MKLDYLLNLLENEKPLDHIVEDGGYCSIFDTIGCIGDSLSSGEFECKKNENFTTYHDMFNYSWGQFIARDAGVKVYNFSRGGMRAKEYMQSFGESIDAFNPEKKCKAYIIALGVNDLFNSPTPITVGGLDDLENNIESFSYYYQKIITTYKEIEPNAKFFLMTFPDQDDSTDYRRGLRLSHREFLYDLSKKYKNTYVLDFFKYAPKYDKDFERRFFLHGHLNPMGYKLTGKMVESYIDYIVRSDFESFKQVGFIGTPQYDEKLDK